MRHQLLPLVLMFLSTDGSVSKGENKIHYLMIAHVKYLPHVLLLAGGLALAGCGGSSDPEEEPGATNPGATAPSASGAKTLALPAGETISNTSGGNVAQTITVASGDTRQIGTTSYFTCTGDPCVISIPAGARSLTQLTYTGGELTRSAIGPAAPTSTRTATPTADDNPLSKGSLLASVRSGSVLGRDVTFDGSTVSTGTFELIDESTGTIWLLAFDDTAETGTSATRTANAADGYGYYGIWTVTADANAAPGSDAATPKRYAEWSGSKAYNQKPSADLDPITATYNGNVLLHQKIGTGSWSASAAGNVYLEANFKGGWIQGIIDRDGTVDADNYDTFVGTVGGTDSRAADDIVLKVANFNSDKFSASAEFYATPAQATTASRRKGSGSWNGQLFGRTTSTEDGVVSHKQPANVLGEFSVSRSKSGTGNSAVDALQVEGVFGANEPST